MNALKTEMLSHLAVLPNECVHWDVAFPSMPIWNIFANISKKSILYEFDMTQFVHMYSNPIFHHFQSKTTKHYITLIKPVSNARSPDLRVNADGQMLSPDSPGQKNSRKPTETWNTRVNAQMFSSLFWQSRRWHCTYSVRHYDAHWTSRRWRINSRECLCSLYILFFTSQEEGATWIFFFVLYKMQHWQNSETHWGKKQKGKLFYWQWDKSQSSFSTFVSVYSLILV